jgi:hypothetical protein
MFNLIMGYAAPTEMQAARMFEYTDDEVKKFIAPGGIVDTSKLGSLPTLVMPELQDSQSEQFAQVGHVEDLSLVGREWRYRFVRNPSVAPTPTKPNRGGSSRAAHRRLGVQPHALGGEAGRPLPGTASI